MANIPDHLRFSDDEQAEIDAIRAAARLRHKKARAAAKARGREDFPESPYEDSWAYEEEFRRNRRKAGARPHYHGHPMDDTSVRIEALLSGKTARQSIE